MCAYTESPRVPTLGVESGIERENEAHKREKKRIISKRKSFLTAIELSLLLNPFYYILSTFFHTHTLTDIYLILLYHYASFFRKKKGFNLCPCAV